MKEELIGILGLKRSATDDEIVSATQKVVMELRGKMGYVSKPLLGKLLDEGYLSLNHMRNTYEIARERLEVLLQGSHPIRGCVWNLQSKK